MRNREDLEKIAMAAAQLLIEEFQAKRVLLIGSVVRGVLHKRSDIDLVVEDLPPQNYIKALTAIYDLLPPGLELDLIPLEDAAPSLRARVLGEGVVLLEASSVAEDPSKSKLKILQDALAKILSTWQQETAEAFLDKVRSGALPDAELDAITAHQLLSDIAKLAPLTKGDRGSTTRPSETTK